MRRKAHRNTTIRKAHPWGTPPWRVDFRPAPSSLPDQVDFAIVGGGFSGLSAAAWLRRFAPGKSVLVLESASLGDGASGRTGGMALSAKRNARRTSPPRHQRVLLGTLRPARGCRAETHLCSGHCAAFRRAAHSHRPRVAPPVLHR